MPSAGRSRVCSRKVTAGSYTKHDLRSPNRAVVVACSRFAQLAISFFASPPGLAPSFRGLCTTLDAERGCGSNSA